MQSLSSKQERSIYDGNPFQSNKLQRIQPISIFILRIEERGTCLQSADFNFSYCEFNFQLSLYYQSKSQNPMMVEHSNSKIKIFIVALILMANFTNPLESIPFQVMSFKVTDNFQAIVFNAGQAITYTVSSSSPDLINIYISSETIQYENSGVGWVSITVPAPATAMYFFYFSTNFQYYSAKTITINRNARMEFFVVTYSPQSFTNYYKFSVTSSDCQLTTITYNGPTFLYQIDVRVIVLKLSDFLSFRSIPIIQFYGEQPFASLSTSLPIGEYIMYSDYDLYSLRGTVTFSLSTSCAHFCPSLFNLPQQQLCLPACGDGVRGEAEQCDNGNKPGCSKSCLPDPNYVCYGPIGSGSLCIKPIICGDGIVDQGQICDNGNRTGCSRDCKVDSGYRCSQEIGKPSICSVCGNGILELGEECDNANQQGCSSCQVQVGFECRGISPSVCRRKNPVCGNGVIEIAEMCDDGNRGGGDGCSRFCTTEFGFSCAGEFGQRSSCSRSSTPVSVCGNSIFEPYPSSSGLIEQCDNGNLQGCQDCRVKSGWFCSSSPGQLSSCFKVTAPTCGDRLFDSGEQCDDGNVENGDGCNFRCQVEFGWTCRRFFQCSRNQTPPPPPPSSLCGNGVVEPGEECDDLGFPVKNGDGCSVRCRIESGWTCTVVEGQSTCRRMT